MCGVLDYRPIFMIDQVFLCLILIISDVTNPGSFTVNGCDMNIEVANDSCRHVWWNIPDFDCSLWTLLVWELLA
jgi:hypothetical protein